VWEGVRLAYPAIFGLDEIPGRTPKLQEGRNMTVDKLVLAVVGQRDLDTDPRTPCNTATKTEGTSQRYESMISDIY